ncbi:MAG: hypothetical protein H0U98_03920 [Alphaproteobacteria bacterium]|nr:hypothetical protein [Alphaproteobacteria bacterium]
MRRGSLLLFLGLMGCALQSMEAGDDASVGNGVTVRAEPGFAQIHLAAMRYWTRNGTGLDELGFYTGIKEGQPLFRVPGLRIGDMPVYRARMTPNDIQDLVVASLVKKKMQNVRTGALRPCPFGTAQGFCFDLTLANDEGLEMRGRAIASARSSVLDLLIFTAPAGYYFDQGAPAAEKIFSSIQTH